MTRQEILATYAIDPVGQCIRNPGKFEGEPIYAPYYWDALLCGCADDETEAGSIFNVLPDDVAEFPELEGIAQIVLSEDSNGFVYIHEIEKVEP